MKQIFIKYLQGDRPSVFSHLFSLSGMDSFDLIHLADSHFSNKFSPNAVLTDYLKKDMWVLQFTSNLLVNKSIWYSMRHALISALLTKL